MGSLHRYGAVAALCGLLAGLGASPAQGAFGSHVTPTGAEELVFDGPGSCPPQPGVDPPPAHTVDGPARAFRDARGRVQMILPQGKATGG